MENNKEKLTEQEKLILKTFSPEFLVRAMKEALEISAIIIWYKENKWFVEKFNKTFPGAAFNPPIIDELIDDKNLLFKWKSFILGIEDTKETVVIKNMAMYN